MAVERIVKRGQHAIGIGDRRKLPDLFRPDDLGMKAHVAMLGALGLQEVEAIGARRKRDAADMVKAAGLA